jgi:hypothetical protein
VPENFVIGESGHLHIWLDPLTRTSESAKPVSEGTEYTFEHVPGGLHTLWVELVRPDRSSFEPKIEASVEFETLGDAANRDTREPPSVPPEDNGGLFLPRGRASSIAAIVLIAVAIVGLWYFFGRPGKEKP